MNQQRSRIMQEARTSLTPAEVLAAAREFFQRRNGVYAAFLEQEGPTHLSFRGQGGEELVLGVRPIVGGTAITGSTYIFDQQIARFFAMLPRGPVEESDAPALTGGTGVPVQAPAAGAGA